MKKITQDNKRKLVKISECAQTFGTVRQPLYSSRALYYWNSLDRGKREDIVRDIELGRAGLLPFNRLLNGENNTLSLSDAIVALARSLSDYLEWKSHLEKTFRHRKIVDMYPIDLLSKISSESGRSQL
jgi:hypothetical protein